jgi:hypothetical protein
LLDENPERKEIRVSATAQFNACKKALEIIGMVFLLFSFIMSALLLSDILISIDEQAVKLVF